MEKEFDQIIGVEISLFQIYDRLLQLELEGKRHSAEYRKVFSFLLDAVEVEKKKLLESRYLKSMPPVILNILLKKSALECEKITFLDGYFQNTVENNAIVSRIVNKMIDIYYEMLIQEGAFFDQEDVMKFLQYIVDYETHVKRLRVLEEFIQSNHGTVKDSLMKFKYGLRYINSDEEQGTFATMNNKPILKSYGYSNEVIEECYHDNIGNILQDALNGILAINDQMVMNTQDGKFQVEILCGEIVTGLHMCSDKEKDSYLQLIKDAFRSVEENYSLVSHNCSYSIGRVKKVLKKNR